MATQTTGPNLSAYIEEGNDSGLATDEQNVSMRIDGRQYGVLAPSEQLFEQPIPPVFRSIADELWRQSAILGLNDDGVTRDQIFAAYRSDLGLLQKYLGDFEGMVKAAIRRSIKCSQGNELSHDKQCEMFQAQLPAIGKDPLLKLSSERAAKPTETLLKELREEFEKGVVRVVSRMAFWIQVLVNNEFVGIITWNSSDVCNYHYFLRENDKRVVDHKENTTSVGLTVTTTTKTAVNERELRERHTHHLVNAKQWAPSEFTQRVPERVARFIESVPSWLIPHLQIVTGEMTMEEVRHTQVSSKTVVTETVSVWRLDPAVAFGRFALLGWTNEETDRELGGTYYRLQPACTTRKRKSMIMTVTALVLLIPIVWFLVTLAISWHAKSVAQAVAAYNTYTDQFAGEKLYTTKKGEVLTLPGPPRQLRYAGIQDISQTHNVRLADGDTIYYVYNQPSETNKVKFYSVPTVELHPEKARTVYGDADLAETGIFAKLRVMEASDNEITYAVSVYQK